MGALIGVFRRIAILIGTEQTRSRSVMGWVRAEEGKARETGVAG
jgi:hypothetical protein